MRLRIIKCNVLKFSPTPLHQHPCDQYKYYLDWEQGCGLTRRRNLGLQLEHHVPKYPVWP
jgi:hypothetical protein